MASRSSRVARMTETDGPPADSPDRLARRSTASAATASGYPNQMAPSAAVQTIARTRTNASRPNADSSVGRTSRCLHLAHDLYQFSNAPVDSGIAVIENTIIAAPRIDDGACKYRLRIEVTEHQRFNGGSTNAANCACL